MIPSLIRTYVPLALAWLVGWLTALGIDVSDATQAGLASGIGSILIGIYYAAVRWAERRWPWASALLGSKQQPAYPADNTP